MPPMEEALSHLRKDCEEIRKRIGKWRLKILRPKTENVIFSSICEEICQPTKKIVLQISTKTLVFERAKNWF